jgi:hypothetical protein
MRGLPSNSNLIVFIGKRTQYKNDILIVSENKIMGNKCEKTKKHVISKGTQE